MAYDKVVDSSVLDAGLKQVADAIREKGGTSDNLAFPTGMAAAVSAIQAGGGGGGTGGSTTVESVPAKDVNFYDYDGTRIAAYTLTEARALTALPTPPAHEGLVFEGWNWELSEINALKFPMEVGAQYYTDDDSVRFYLCIEDIARSEVGFTLGGSVSVSCQIDWGDGTVESGIKRVAVSHKYSATGDYCVRIFRETTFDPLAFSKFTGIFISTLRAIETAKYYASIDTQIIGVDSAVRYITVHKDMTGYQPTGVRCNIMPRGCAAAYGRESARTDIVSIAPTQTGWGVYGFMGNRAVQRITMPEGITAIAYRTFRYCNSLTKLVIPSTVTDIGTQCISCTNLACIVSLPTTPPTLEGTNSIESIPTDCVIYVPDASVDAYKGATNWSTYADRILPLSEYPYSDIII